MTMIGCPCSLDDARHHFIIITAFPVITVALVLPDFDRLFGAHFLCWHAGATPILWQHLFWLFGHPGSTS